MSREKALAWMTENDANLVDLDDHVAVVTGANTGTGKFVAHGLALRGAHVVLACRDFDKGIAAATEIADAIAEQTGADTASLEVQRLDLSNRASIYQAAENIRRNHNQIDVLVNNAGVGLLEEQVFAEEGFRHHGEPIEMQFAVNYLGHFALTGLLWPTIVQTPQSRIVNVASNGHKFVQPNLEDLNHVRMPYKHLVAYSRSKLAQLQSTYALQRKLEAIGSSTIAVAAHPGVAMTDFMRNKARINKKPVRATLQALRLAQSPEMGALPMIYAAAGHDVHGGAYYGPGGFQELAGIPKEVHPHARALDIAVQNKLWALSEEITGIKYPTTATGAHAE